MPSLRLLAPALFALAFLGATAPASADSFTDGQRTDIEAIVRNYLVTHPEVLEAAVVAVDDERYGRRLHAAVHRRPGSALDSLQLRRHCVERLSSGAGVPKTMAIGDQALPRTSTGKVDRNRIKESGWTA